MMIGLVQPGTSRGTFLQMIGSRNTTPPRMLRMVPFGDFHISFSPNSFTRASSGVMVPHLTPTPTFLRAWAASTVTWSLVLSRYSIPKSKYIRLISRNGVISLSLMYRQMIRVISSPSSSTTGLVTLIFAMGIGPYLEGVWRRGDGPLPVRPYSIVATGVEGEWAGRFGRAHMPWTSWYGCASLAAAGVFRCPSGELSRPLSTQVGQSARWGRVDFAGAKK